LSGRAAPDRPVARLTLHCGPPAGASHPPKTPVSRLLPRPGVSPEWCPFPVGEVFSTPSPSAPQEVRAIYFCSFLNPHDVHRIRAVIRMYLGLSTILCTTRPQVTGCDLQATIIGFALCNRPVFNCRCPLSARLCYHRKPDRVTCAPLRRRLGLVGVEGRMGDGQVAAGRHRRHQPGHDSRRVLGVGDQVQHPNDSITHRPDRRRAARGGVGVSLWVRGGYRWFGDVAVYRYRGRRPAVGG
jgi:hypothetical protein